MHRLVFSLLIGGLFLLNTSAQAQFRKIPSSVTDSFKLKYPSAAAVEWQDKVTAFQANFTQENEKYQARFSSKGEWQGTTKRISEDKIPAAVKDGLAKSKYAAPDWKIGTITVKYLPDGKTQYGIFVSKSDINRKNLLFSSEGQLLKDGSTL